MFDVLALGPLNGVLLLLLLLGGGVAAASALRRVHHGEIAAGYPLVIGLALPLGLAVWASNGQLAGAMEEAMTHAHPLGRQTLMAMALQRALLTQLYAGVGVTVLAGGLLVGLLALVVEGERPRLALGQAAMVLGASIVLVAAAAYPVAPGGILAARVVLYALGVLAAVTAMIGAHRRGPGVQLATLAGIALPMLIAGVDQATIAWITATDLQSIAAAEPSARVGMMNGTIGAIESLRAFSAVHLGLAAGLALLGPVAAWRRERPVAVHHLLAMSAGVVLASVGVGWASAWLVGF